MVLDAAFYASTVTSLMMNGVCCVWQMQQEEEQRASFRQDIRAEYERQREEEFKMWEKHQSFYCSDGDSSTFSSSLSPHSEPYMLREKVVREKMNLSARMHRRESDAWEANTRRTVSTSPPRRLPLRVPMVPASPALKNHRFAAQHAFPANEQQEEEAPREQPPQLIEETNINHKNYHNNQGFLQHHEQQPQNPSLYYCPRYPSSSRSSHQQQVNQEEPPSLIDLDDEEARDEVTETTSMVSVAIQ